MNKWHHSKIQSNTLSHHNRVSTSRHRCTDSHVMCSFPLNEKYLPLSFCKKVYACSKMIKLISKPAKKNGT